MHKSIEISLIVAESRKWSKIWSGNPWNNDWVCETAPGIHCSFAGITMVWDGSVANTLPLEFQKSLHCWKTISILFNATYPFYVENIEFLIKVIDVNKLLYDIYRLFVIIYDGHIVKWQPQCKHLNILIVYETSFAFLKFSTYNLFPNHLLTVCCHFEAKCSNSV